MTLHPTYRLIGHSLYKVTHTGRLVHCIILPPHIHSLHRAIGYYESMFEVEDDGQQSS